MPDYDLAKLVTVATFTSPWEAQLARARLESEGIVAMIADENLIRMDWMISAAVGGVKLQVGEADAHAAVEALHRTERLPELYLLRQEEAPARRCPGCRSEDLYLERWSRGLFLVGTLLLGFPLPLLRRRWHCRQCREVWRPEEVVGTDAPIELPETLVTVGSFDHPLEAQLASTRLAAEDIDACVLEERLPMVNLWSGEVRTTSRVQVRESDAGRAREVLAGEEEEAILPGAAE
jgi:hypothetical protein